MEGRSTREHENHDVENSKDLSSFRQTRIHSLERKNTRSLLGTHNFPLHTTRIYRQPPGLVGNCAFIQSSSHSRYWDCYRFHFRRWRSPRLWRRWIEGRSTGTVWARGGCRLAGRLRLQSHHGLVSLGEANVSVLAGWRGQGICILLDVFGCCRRRC